MRLQQLREMAIGPKYKGKWYWHVTTGDSARQIAKDGHLKAKEVSFESGSWRPRPGRIYITNDPSEVSYYFKIRWGSKEPKEMGIVRIDVSKVMDLIEPDEDYVADIMYTANSALFKYYGKEENIEFAKRIIASSPESFKKRAEHLFKKDFKPYEERRRGSWLKWAKDVIPHLKDTSVWDELLSNSKSGSVEGPLLVNAVWIIDTQKDEDINFSFSNVEDFLKKFAERIL